MSKFNKKKKLRWQFSHWPVDLRSLRVNYISKLMRVFMKECRNSKLDEVASAMKSTSIPCSSTHRRYLLNISLELLVYSPFRSTSAPVCQKRTGNEQISSANHWISPVQQNAPLYLSMSKVSWVMFGNIFVSFWRTVKMKRGYVFSLSDLLHSRQTVGCPWIQHSYAGSRVGVSPTSTKKELGKGYISTC